MSTPEALGRLLAERQADRLPSVAAAVVRNGEIAWSGAAGVADYDESREATAETQYRIGSI
ncbi:MAG: serine hydrolase, partial [Gaiellaceae bacterium]